MEGLCLCICVQVGRTPIMAAASKGHKEVIKVLLKHGADILLTSYDVSVVFVYNVLPNAQERLGYLFTFQTLYMYSFLVAIW